ncbi:MAG TPA: sensor histidine kinase, partial [Brevundimonas sp.]
ILRHETEAHDPTRIVINGPRVALGPAAALSLGMIFHELATNAAKYGALSNAEQASEAMANGRGRVFVDWSVANQAERRLTIHWRELDGPPVAEPTRRGFGSRLIERNVRHDLAGEVKFTYAIDGLRADISIPLDKEND